VPGHCSIGDRLYLTGAGLRHGSAGVQKLQDIGDMLGFALAGDWTERTNRRYRCALLLLVPFT